MTSRVSAASPPRPRLKRVWGVPLDDRALRPVFVLRGFTAAAEVKLWQAPEALGRGHVYGLRGFTAAAELKLLGVRASSIGRIEAVLRGFTAAAELKPFTVPAGRRSCLNRSPRLHRRGRIEASVTCTPNSAAAALIVLRGFTAAAELKRLRTLRRVTADVAEGRSPRLHRRGRIEAARSSTSVHVGMGASPRLHRRGRIEARTRRPRGCAVRSPRFTAAAELKPDHRRRTQRRGRPQFSAAHRRGRIEALDRSAAQAEAIARLFSAVHRRGRIEAAGTVRRLKTGWQVLRGFTAAAELKQERVGDGRPLRFSAVHRRGRIEASAARVRCRHIGSCSPRFTAAAELKRCWGRTATLTAPRLHRRGRIRSLRGSPPRPN